MADAPAIGIDFGTSNSAVAVLRGGRPHLIEIEPGQTTLPTAFFFDFTSRKTLIGHAAGAALTEGREGRYMRALKRVLGTGLMHEKRQILNERVTFVDIIGRFLSRLRAAAEVELGSEVTRVLSGRPVHFHDRDGARDARAEADLRLCYQAAGFDEIAFLPEPEAAALAGGPPEGGGLGLIVDIGGGTSDFSLYQAGPKGLNILANHGVRIGGTDFDRALSFDLVMPLLGRGAKLRREFGAGLLEAPSALFGDLATWEKIPFSYNGQILRLAREMRQLATEPALLERLVTVLEHELGHDIAFAVEAAKIAANGQAGQGAVALDFIEKGLEAIVWGPALKSILAPFASAIGAASAETLALAGVTAAQVERVTYVGGSSLLGAVAEEMRRRHPGAQHVFSEVFTAVADGLAIAAGRR